MTKGGSVMKNGIYFIMSYRGVLEVPRPDVNKKTKR